MQWWDAVQQTNRPHGIAFKKIKGGVIRDLKIWKVRLEALFAYTLARVEDLIAARCMGFFDERIQ